MSLQKRQAITQKDLESYKNELQQSVVQFTSSLNNVAAEYKIKLEYGFPERAEAYQEAYRLCIELRQAALTISVNRMLLGQDVTGVLKENLEAGKKAFMEKLVAPHNYMTGKDYYFDPVFIVKVGQLTGYSVIVLDDEIKQGVNDTSTISQEMGRKLYVVSDAVKELLHGSTENKASLPN